MDLHPFQPLFASFTLGSAHPGREFLLIVLVLDAIVHSTLHNSAFFRAFLLLARK